jgi:hypothetical protein
VKNIFFTIRAFDPGSPVYSVTVKLPSGETCEVLEGQSNFGLVSWSDGISVMNGYRVSDELYEWLLPIFEQFDPNDPYKYYEPYAVWQVVFTAQQIFDYQDELPFIDCWPINLITFIGREQ